MNAQERQLRQELISYAKALNSTGLSEGKSGNLSVRCDNGLLITPSGLDYQSLKPADIVKLTLAGEKCCDSPYSASSEWHFHCGIYQNKPAISAIVHAHPNYSTALACTSRAIPAFHYMVAIAGGTSIPLASYAIFGSEQLSVNTLNALKTANACLLENHGLVVCGSNLSKTFQLTEEIETLAKQYCLALSIGNVKLLTEEEMQAVIEKFKDYQRG